MTTPLERLRNDRGASAVEYGLILVGIAAVIVAIVILLGGQVSEMFNDTCESISNQASTGSCNN